MTSKQKQKKVERILPAIELKYFAQSGNKLTDADAQCAFCKKKNIAIGGELDAHTNDPKVICEDCAIDRFQQEYSFASREAAAARRRRIFDVMYLLHELIIDDYLEFAAKIFDDLTEEEANELLEVSQFVYNVAFTKAQKEKLEILVHQQTIEKRLRPVVLQLGYYLNLREKMETAKDEVHLFDDCPLCQMMKDAEHEGRSLNLEELKSGFRELEKKNGIVGRSLFDEE